jgi:hypothetical protein
MDELSFDALTRAFTTARSRRGALSALLGGALGLLGLADTSARKHQGDRTTKISCPPCQKRKHGECRATKTNPKKVRQCPGGTCQGGVCVQSVEQPPEQPPTCPAGECSRNRACGPGCVCLDIGGGTKRCLALGTCSGIGDCQANACASDCTCVNPGGRKSGCTSTAGCPTEKGKCTRTNDYCGPDCICVGEGAAARCASVAL